MCMSVSSTNALKRVFFSFCRTQNANAISYLEGPGSLVDVMCLLPRVILFETCL